MQYWRSVNNRNRNHKCRNFFQLLVSILILEIAVSAQEMEPRAYSRAPVGTTYVFVIYAFQTGDVLTDSSTPIRDVSVKLNSMSLGFGRTFNLVGRQANFGALLNYADGRARGTVFEQAQEVTRSGMGDTRLRFSTNLIGGPALSPKEFAAHKPKTVVGVSLTAVVPTGQYDPNRLVNLGSNRWSFKPEVGLSKPVGRRWTFEVAGGIWLFTANNNFFGGSRREQRPLASLQAHVIYTLRPRMWIALDGTYFNGGRTALDGVKKDDSVSNSRLGGTFSYPFGKRHSLKVVIANGLTTRFGGKLTTFAIGWQYTWF